MSVRRLLPVLTLSGCVVALAASALAQVPEAAIKKDEKASVPARPAPSPVPTVMVEITINRLRDGKRISSIPYTLAVSPDGPRSTLRLGGEVPLPTTTFTPPKGAESNPVASFQYRNVGTNIDVNAFSVSGGSYRLAVTIDESSVYPGDEAEKSGMTSAPAIRASGAPAFRSLRASNSFNIRDGQTVEFSAGSDPISGETARISVKLAVAK